MAHTSLVLLVISLCGVGIAMCDVFYTDNNNKHDADLVTKKRQGLSDRRSFPEKTELVDGFGDETVPLEEQVFGTGAGRFQWIESRLQPRRPLGPRLPTHAQQQNFVLRQPPNEKLDDTISYTVISQHRSATDAKSDDDDEEINKNGPVEQSLSEGGFELDDAARKLLTQNSQKELEIHEPVTARPADTQNPSIKFPDINRNVDRSQSFHQQTNHQVHTAAKGSGTLRQLYAVKFRHEFQRWNPRSLIPNNVSSDFVWLRSDNTTFDNALFLNSGYEGVDLLTMPFRNYDPVAVGSAGDRQIEAAMVFNASKFRVNADQVLTLRTRFDVQLFNIRLNSFPQPVEVVNVDDDLRLGHSGVALTANNNEFWFGIVATNNGVWGTYERRLRFEAENNATWPAFTVVKSLTDRSPLQSRNSFGGQEFYKDARPFVTASIQYDGVHKVVNYYVNGRLLWKVSNFGVLPTDNDDGNVLVYRLIGQQLDTSVDINDLSIVYFTRQALDWADPNQPGTEPLRGLVKIDQNDSNKTYANGTTFYDPLALRSNIVRGQGAILTLQDLSVVGRTLGE